ncbi:HNH endonuclease [Mycobacterium pseudokansasii]|uniref:HNH endonuclease n=1 Tax=Mycobacterium pseudokansasii TaxID=2341080 RepID=UPI000A8BB299|nr:HNH endonuclease [Mycobacterium pseudokansasii]
MRDNFACVMCHRSDVPREVGHLVSVHDGHVAGLSDADLTSDENLATMCAECNSGLSKRSLPPHLIAAAIWAHRRLHQGQRSPHPA